MTKEIIKILQYIGIAIGIIILAIIIVSVEIEILDRFGVLGILGAIAIIKYILSK